MNAPRTHAFEQMPLDEFRDWFADEIRKRFEDVVEMHGSLRQKITYRFRPVIEHCQFPQPLSPEMASMVRQIVEAVVGERVAEPRTYAEGCRLLRRALRFEGG